VIAGKWEWRVFFLACLQFGGTLACSFNSQCTAKKPENFTAEMIDEWLAAEYSQGCFLEKFFRIR